VNDIICKNISRHLPIFTAHSSSLWDMMRRIVGNMNSYMKDQGTHIEFKEKHNKKEIMHSSTPQEEDEEEVWVEVEDNSSVITAHN
jgi:hypothetical protein